MAEATNAATEQPEPAKKTDEVVESKVVALAEQIGWFLGTVQNKTEGWLNREALSKQVSRIRDRVKALAALQSALKGHPHSPAHRTYPSTRFSPRLHI